jgi:hypothetical protein
VTERPTLRPKPILLYFGGALVLAAVLGLISGLTGNDYRAPVGWLYGSLIGAWAVFETHPGLGGRQPLLFILFLVLPGLPAIVLLVTLIARLGRLVVWTYRRR